MDHVTRNALAARNNEAKGLGKAGREKGKGRKESLRPSSPQSPSVLLSCLRFLNLTNPTTGNPKAVLANRKIRCIFALLANKITCIYLCSCVCMSRFGRDLNPIRDG